MNRKELELIITEKCQIRLKGIRHTTTPLKQRENIVLTINQIFFRTKSLSVVKFDSKTR